MAQKINFLKANKEGSDKYTLYLEEKRQFQQNRRRVLNTFAAINQAEKEEFDQKYRYFQVHKWTILKAIKENMLEYKIKRNAKRK